MKNFLAAFALGLLLGAIGTAYFVNPAGYDQLKAEQAALLGKEPISETPDESETVQPALPIEETTAAPVPPLPAAEEAPQSDPIEKEQPTIAPPASEPETASPEQTLPSGPATAEPEPVAPAPVTVPTPDQETEAPETKPLPAPVPSPTETNEPAPQSTEAPKAPEPPESEQPEEAQPAETPIEEPLPPTTEETPAPTPVPEPEVSATEPERPIPSSAQATLEKAAEKTVEIAQVTKDKAIELSQRAEPYLDQSVDIAIATAIRAQLKLDRRIESDSISITVVNREVTLSGKVPDDDTKRLAIEIAVTTKGVDMVLDEISLAQ